MKSLRILVFLPLIFIVSNCTKSGSKSPAPTPTPTPTPASPYYFKFAFHDSSFNFTSDLPQYMPFSANEAGGYEMITGISWPSAGLRLSWPNGDTVKESDLMGLIGKTLHFSDTMPRPEVSYDATPSSLEWYSVDTLNTVYNVKITNVTYLKKDTTVGVPVKAYVITGTCSALLTNYTSFQAFTGGSFNFIISRQDL
jgi:hypothetical protein